MSHCREQDKLMVLLEGCQNRENRAKLTGIYHGAFCSSSPGSFVAPFSLQCSHRISSCAPLVSFLAPPQKRIPCAHGKLENGSGCSPQIQNTGTCGWLECLVVETIKYNGWFPKLVFLTVLFPNSSVSAVVISHTTAFEIQNALYNQSFYKKLA